MKHIALTLLVTSLLAAAAARALPSEITDTTSSEHAQVRAIGLSEATWTRGFWADRFAACRDSSVPAMWELMKGVRYKPFYEHFLIAAGEREGEHHGAKWNDGDFYKWLEAACSVLAVGRDPELAKIIDECVVAIGKAQRDDGYIHTPVLIRHRNGDASAQPFQDRHNFEMYNMGHLITAACVHHRVTGEDGFLSIARKTADFLDRWFADPTPELARNSVCPSHYMAMVELYRETREPRYLQLARRFLDMRNVARDGGDDNQDRIPFTQQREAVGHAVRANYLYAGAADVFLETGDPASRIALDAIWRNVTERKMYITGGCGALYDGASPAGSPRQSSITRVHQAYGRNYQLPHTTAHNETCAAIGNVLWNWRMFLASGAARYLDVLELTLYNGVLAGVSLEGTDYFYVNPLRNEQPLPTELRWSRTRVPFVTSYCCPPNVARTIAQVNGYAYAKTDDSVFINLYGGGTLDTELLGQRLRLAQRTNYPWDGAVAVAVRQCPDAPFSLKLRIPGWADTWEVNINGNRVAAAPDAAGFVDLRRVWRAGDEVSLHFDMPVRLMEAHPLVEEARNQVAVKRGPIVYCLESIDLPEGVRVRDMALRPTASFKISQSDDLLDGVAALETELVHLITPEWSTRLYRPRPKPRQATIATRLIPYFAWSNRGECEMSVWLPLAPEQ